MVELNSEEDQKMTYEKLMEMKQVILVWRQREQDQETQLLQEIRTEEEANEGKKMTCEKIYSEIEKKTVELCSLRADLCSMEAKLNLLKEVRATHPQLQD